MIFIVDYLADLIFYHCADIST